VLAETQRLRRAIGLPNQFVVLGEPPESLLVLNCESGEVLWCDAIDAERLGREPLLKRPDTWPHFADFLEYLLNEEEREQA
jgi:hypothetical protein